MLLELSHAHVTVEVDPERVRASGTPALVADCTRFRACTGWQPEISFRQTLSDLLDYERDRLKTRTEEQA
jgi:nucleoside-diphosphate-sugar epimerase